MVEGLRLDRKYYIPPAELHWQVMTAQGSGGQNVNKVATAVQLRFDIRTSSLPEEWKQRLLRLPDQRITKDGVVVIKAQQHRTQNRNRQDALQRLRELCLRAKQEPRRRKATRPTLSSNEKRLEKKAQRGRVKSLRRSIDD